MQGGLTMNNKTIEMLKKQFKPGDIVTISSKNTINSGVVIDIDNSGLIQIESNGCIKKYSINDFIINKSVCVPESIKKEIEIMKKQGINPYILKDVRKYAQQNNRSELLSFITTSLDHYINYIANL